MLNPDIGAGYQVLHGAGLQADQVGEVILLGLLRCEDRDINSVLAELGVWSDNIRTPTARTIGRAA